MTYNLLRVDIQKSSQLDHDTVILKGFKESVDKAEHILCLIDDYESHLKQCEE